MILIVHTDSGYYPGCVRDFFSVFAVIFAVIWKNQLASISDLPYNKDIRQLVTEHGGNYGDEKKG